MSFKRKQEDKLRSPVARYARKYNKAAIHTDRKREARRVNYTALRGHLTTKGEY